MTARTGPNPVAARAFALDTLQRLGEQRDRVEADIRDAALGAYAAGGVTWEQIGAALGVTGSVAWHLGHSARAHTDQAGPDSG